MPEGPKDDLNKWSRKITQPKSQGASQVSATLHPSSRDSDPSSPDG